MHDLDIALVAAFVLGFGLLSRLVGRTPLTGPILAVAFGVLVGPDGLDAVHFRVEDDESVRLLAEFTLALVLFHDAARVDLRLLARNLGPPERMLTVGLAGTIALGFGLGLLLLDGLDPWEIGLLAALLAPTDAALGQAVVEDEAVPATVRQALNVESGLNDGLVVPVVAVLTMGAAGSGGAEDGPATWLVHAGRVAGIGAGAGVLLGLVAARGLDAAERGRWMESAPRRAAVAAVPVVAFFAAEGLGGSGFLAAFTCGLAVGSTARALGRDAFDFNEEAGTLLGLVTWVAFGVAAVPHAIGCFEPGVLAYAVLSLTVVRMVPVALSLVGRGLGRDTVLFLGWFGPRGLATVVFAITVLDRDDIPGAERIFGVAVWTVLLSVLAHGLSARFLARGYGARHPAG